MQSGRLHHFAVRCIDLDESIRFYREGLGYGEPREWSFPPHVGRAAFLPARDGSWIELFAGGSVRTREEPTEGLVHVALAFDDVDAAHARAVAVGANSIQAPTSFTLPEWRVRLAFVEGPSGERIELYRTTLST